ncbi:hypothetical protein [Acinetobacter soli]|uniref:hypothetical protein n=1 Tax=Acinetobacter soli TaxID=487316 RepID=UPI003A84C483
MNLLQYYLGLLTEECNEVGQIASKCSRFGLLEQCPGLDLNNKARLHGEINDFFAVIEELNEKFDFGFKPDPIAIKHKRVKKDKYLRYSIDLGTVIPFVHPNLWKESSNG